MTWFSAINLLDLLIDWLMVLTTCRSRPAHLVQRSWRRRLSRLAADEEERCGFLAATKQVGQVLVRAGQEKPLLLQTAERTWSWSSCYCILHITIPEMHHNNVSEFIMMHFGNDDKPN